MKTNGTILLLSLMALNDTLALSDNFEIKFQAHCQDKILCEKGKILELILEKITSKPSELSKLECLLLENYLVRFKYYYYRFFQLKVMSSKIKLNDVVLLTPELNRLAIENIFLLQY